MGKPIQSWKNKGMDIAAWPTRNNGYSFTIQKRYKDKQTQEWKTTTTYFPDDLAVLLDLINQAKAWAHDNGLENTGPIDTRPAAPEVKAVVQQMFEDDEIPF